MHVDPAQFMPTVSALHENKPGRKKSSVGKNPKSVAEFKKAGKPELFNPKTKRRERRERRETIIPTYQDVVDSNLIDTELYNNNLGVV